MNFSRLTRSVILVRSYPGLVAAAQASRSASSNAVISAHAPVDGERAPDQTERRGQLSGRRIAVKDNISTAQLPTTCASDALRDYQSPRDATVVRLLRDEGAVIDTKTNMDEFGMGSHSVNSAFGPVQNVGPDGEGYSAGGSSGGSAVSVAGGSCWALVPRGNIKAVFSHSAAPSAQTPAAQFDCPPHTAESLALSHRTG
jgi:Asp-tRNA(Asn)/Glu-tRNA(Gln) amidotransferase A subunit family amidase